MTNASGSADTGVVHHRATVNGVTLHYVAAGPLDTPAVILLHGFPQNWLIWRGVLPALALRYRTVAVDLRGYGESDKPPGIEGYDKRTMAADIHALVGQLGLRQPLVVGHDRGARVARRYALDYPDELAGAALLDILPAEWVYDRLSAAEVAQRYWHWVFHLIPELPEQLIAGREDDYLTAVFGRTPGFLKWLHTSGAWDEYLRAFRQPGAVAAVLNDYRATYAVDVPRYREERTQGTQVRVPVLLLWGERGNLGGRPVLDAWREVASDVRGIELAECGHYLPEEQPDTVARHLLSFADERFASSE